MFKYLFNKDLRVREFGTILLTHKNWHEVFIFQRSLPTRHWILFQTEVSFSIDDS